MISKRVNVLALTSLSLILCFQNCSRYAFTKISVSESVARKFSVFVEDGVDSIDGQMPSENLRVKSVSEAQANLVQDCSEPGLKDKERAEVLAAAEADPTNKTIPIAFSISLGRANDGMAYWAHKRAVLSESNPGVSYIPVGGKNTSVYGVNGAQSMYYTVDHDKAKSDFINGKKCFYSTVKVKSTQESEQHYFNFIQGEIPGGLSYDVHNVHYMYYGWCGGGNCAADGNYGKDEHANRLFSALPAVENGERQIVKLYMADLRESHFQLGEDVLKVAESTTRGQDLSIEMKNILHLEVINRNLGQTIRNLSASFKAADGTEFAGMSGVPQLLHNILLGSSDGSVLASSYTPIVLDLGKPKVFTSSVTWGTFFDMASRDQARGLASVPQPHRTAWLSGELADWTPKMKDGRKFSMDARRTVEDGFLVLADDQGQVNSSRQLFGDRMIVNGETYANGFLALQALGKKDCTSSDPKLRYLGAWDNDLYASKIKVWVDRDRNGAVGEGELSSLIESKVLAINTCNIDHSEANDRFGNGTNLRSAFLKASDTDLKVSEDEVLSRLETGETSDGKSAEFRLAIDLVFKVNEDLRLK